MKNKIKFIELFAGVGGFRLGLEGWQNKSPSSGYKNKMDSSFSVVWSNQWEPSTKSQHASDIYVARWSDANHSNEDISNVNIKDIPSHDLLVGGFPCQDYSVATTLKNSKGLIGKKGVLWWSIHKILSESRRPTKYLILENVDRLLISPSSQRGRDFAIILHSLNTLGYTVEWRVINAAEFGMPQRRRRVFIVAYHSSTKLHKDAEARNLEDLIISDGILASTFPCTLDTPTKQNSFKLDNDLVEVSNNFNKGQKPTQFHNAGLMRDGLVTSIKVKPIYLGNYKVLGDVVIDKKVDASFYIDKDSQDKWNYLKGAKKEYRKNADGFEYHYAEGGMIFPDALDKASRTIITGEGGISPSRFKHVIETKDGLRRLTPIELERLNMFPDNHTQLDGVSDTKRAFLMGNALVVGVVEKIGANLSRRIFEI